MKTFILFWNPALSDVKLEDWRKMIDSEDIFDCSWSVWEHGQADDFEERFFMVRCGEGNTGICQSGRFCSKPYQGKDWSGMGREVYYVDLDVEVMIDSEHCPVLTTDILQREMPDFEWTGGHSGRVLPPEYAKKLESLWKTFLEEHKEMFCRHAIKRELSDSIYVDEDDNVELMTEDSDEDDKCTAEVSLDKSGEISIELRDRYFDEIKTIRAYTWKEAMDKINKLLQVLSKTCKVDEFGFIDFYGSMTPEYVKALDIASWAHRDQKDKAGKPYFGHLARVSMACDSNVAKIVALLHDVLEDTDLTQDKLEEMGISEFIVKSVVCLTRKPEESYDDFIKRLAPNPIAREVKIADLEDNMDVRRMQELGETDTQRLNKYIKAWNYLNNYKAE